MKKLMMFLIAAMLMASIAISAELPAVKTTETKLTDDMDIKLKPLINYKTMEVKSITSIKEAPNLIKISVVIDGKMTNKIMTKKSYDKIIK